VISTLFLTARGVICTSELASFQEGLVRGLCQLRCQLDILKESFISKPRHVCLTFHVLQLRYVLMFCHNLILFSVYSEDFFHVYISFYIFSLLIYFTYFPRFVYFVLHLVFLLLIYYYSNSRT
jgi:hypothetical protein